MSTQPYNDGTDLAKKVEPILRDASRATERPNDAQLVPVYDYLIPSRSIAGPSSASTHWYCPKTRTKLHTEAATWLIILFAFRKAEKTKIWISHLERVLGGCEECSRHFTAARKRLLTKYLSNYPPTTSITFPAAVDQWEAQYVIDKHEIAASQLSSHSSTYLASLLILDSTTIQLLLSQPSLLNDNRICEIIDETVNLDTKTCMKLLSHGLTPMLVNLLFSPVSKRRIWAKRMLVRATNPPQVTLKEWTSLGIGAEVEKALNEGRVEEKELWASVNQLLDSGYLSVEAIQHGLLGSSDLLIRLAGSLSKDSEAFPVALTLFNALLSLAPKEGWTVLSQGKFVSSVVENPSFLGLLKTRYSTPDASDQSVLANGKGKGKHQNEVNPLDLFRQVSSSIVEAIKAGSSRSEMVLKALVAAMSGFCLDRVGSLELPVTLRAAAIGVAIDCIDQLHRSLEGESIAALDFYSKRIMEIAFHQQSADSDIWRLSRQKAQHLVTKLYEKDCKDVRNTVLDLSTIIQQEKRRQQQVKRSKTKGPTPTPPRTITSLHRVQIHKDLWESIYDIGGAMGPDAITCLIRSLSSIAHIEKLDRYETWGYDMLKLQEIIKEDEYAAAVRAINSSIRSSRDKMPLNIEMFALRCPQHKLRGMWDVEGVARAGIKLLLSPVEDVHDAMINLLQQSFDDVDDRSDCFRVILQRYPLQGILGLNDFLEDFQNLASKTPESCSLSKWLVRCFTDVLEVLCNQSSAEEPLFQSSAFLTLLSEGIEMRKAVETLWDRMTIALATIFKQTPEWAPLYDPATMVDWMRDALIFGRQIVQHFRAFEAAVSGDVDNHVSSHRVPESPIRSTSSETRLLRQLDLVLNELALWLRLTDVETLHQAFELIKTILGRIAKTQPNVPTLPILEKALLELDHFSRRDGKKYLTRLSDDTLSELADLLTPFNLVFEVDDDERPELPTRTAKAAIEALSSSSASRPSSGTSRGNAFETMMKNAAQPRSDPIVGQERGKGKAPEKLIRSDSPEYVGDEFDDDFFNAISTKDLEKLENKAKVAAKGLASSVPRRPRSSEPTRPVALPGVSTSSRTTLSTPAANARPSVPGKLNVNVVPKPAPKPSGSSKFKSQIMRDLRREHQSSIEQRRAIGGITQKVPVASNLGTGLGAYTGKKESAKVVDASRSSSPETSDSSDDDRGLNAIVAKQKRSPQKAPKLLPERRPLKPLQSTNQVPTYQSDRERRRAEQHAMRQRLKPDLHGLYKYILAWNPDHEGTIAPHPPEYQAQLSTLTNVPIHVNSCDQYDRIMLPLFLQELWAQFKQERASTPPIQIEVSTRTYEDEFIDMELSVQGYLPEILYFNESDIVVLRRRDCVPVTAKIQDFKRRPRDVILKVRILGMVDQKALGSKMKWQLQKHMSLSTAIREYAALRGLPYYDASLLADILAARSAVMRKFSSGTIADAQKAYDLNEPQAKAVLGALDTRGFALIQGPPGTGKTKTIRGLVGKFLSERRATISTAPGDIPQKSKLLVCAPSNAAIDEVCKRLMDGVPTSSGNIHRPNVVRIGIDSSVNMAVKDVSLDSLVEARVSSEVAAKGGGGGDYGRIQADLEDVKVQIREKMERIQKLQATKQDLKLKDAETELHALTLRRTQLGAQSSKAKDAARDATRHLDAARRAARDAILTEADIICATLAGSGHDSLAPYTFETVIIDESAQAIELSCLIPLKYGCKRCVMVGDPNQLPPTTISQDVEKFHYNESLFVRLTKRSTENVQLLSIQYRMHPLISELPSKVFYNGQLKDGPSMANKTAAIWHSRKEYGPYVFFNVEGMESKSGTSTLNTFEALVAVDLYKGLEAEVGDKINLALRIGVITMYREQLWEMRRRFTDAYGASILERIEFNTVDGFQGQEKDIIILSCVRSGPGLQSIGFLKDPRRMNVALTRAKSSLFIIGNGPTLERSDDRWKTIVQDARERSVYIDYGSTTFAKVHASIVPKKAKDPRRRSQTPLAGSSKGTKSPSIDEKPNLSNGAASLKRKASVDSITKSPLKRKVSDASSTESRKQKVKTNGGLSKKGSPGVSPEASKGSNVTNGASKGDVTKAYKPAPVIRPPQPKTMPPPLPKPPKKPEDSMFIKKKKKPKPS